MKKKITCNTDLIEAFIGICPENDNFAMNAIHDLAEKVVLQADQLRVDMKKSIFQKAWIACAKQFIKEAKEKDGQPVSKIVEAYINGNNQMSQVFAIDALNKFSDEYRKSEIDSWFLSALDWYVQSRRFYDRDKLGSSTGEETPKIRLLVGFGEYSADLMHNLVDDEHTADEILEELEKQHETNNRIVWQIPTFDSEEECSSYKQALDDTGIVCRTYYIEFEQE